MESSLRDERILEVGHFQNMYALVAYPCPTNYELDVGHGVDAVMASKM